MKLFRICSFNLLLLYLMISEDHSGSCLDAVWQLSKPSISHLQAVSDKRSLLASWQLNHSSLEDVIYEIQIGRTENHIVIYNENMSVQSTDSHEYTWTWTSDLPLECVDHSVRIRLLHNHSVQSPWSDWKTNYGNKTEDRAEIFPIQRVLREGTTATFCCVPPKGVNITSIRFNNSNQSLISISDRVKAITVHNVTIPPTLIDALTISCSDDTGNVRVIWNYISSPPQKPRNLSCVTTDVTTVTCTWDSVHKHEVDDHNRKTHTLHIQNSDQFPFPCKQSPCTFPAVPQLEEYNISVVVRDQLGGVTEIYSFNISERVFPVVEFDRVSPGVTDSTVSWFVQGNLTRLNLLCQVTTNSSSTTEMRCEHVSGFCSSKLEHLLPNTRYTTRIRCSADGRLWGERTPPVTFTTYPLVTLDVWRSIKQQSDANNRQVTLLWTPLIPGSAVTVNIQNYIIQWTQEGINQSVWRDSGQTQAEVSIGPGQCDFAVQTVIRGGSSIPAHITVLQRKDQKAPPAEKRLSSSISAAGFNLSWELHEAATCGYTVEWCIAGNAALSNLRWVKVAQGNNSLFLPARHFKAGCRYTFNIYGCRENAHQLLEAQTGYLQELKSVPSPRLVEPVQSTSSSVTLEWHYNEDDAAQPAFITGYLVTVQAVGSDKLSGHVADLFNMSVADPHTKSVTAKGLQQNQEYTFSVSALTKEGPGHAASITVRTKTDYTAHMAKILTPIVLLLCCTILLWPQRRTLKSGLKEIFVYPAGMNIKIPELDSFLQETERLPSQKPEECISCDIEILNTRPFLIETTQRDLEPLNTPPPSPPASSLLLSCEAYQMEYCPQLWDGAALQQTTCITNRTYFDTTEEDPSDTQEIVFPDFKPSFELFESLPESCHVTSGYLPNEAI
ncbi:leukemia inhibitory factor receptor [Halichoeres trimaculatus]|uniref:leukemia inhibitory factor receptor n=1 Tax=Halichoeres trimaculatus TaxID=147232 RepID=UPI003D9E3673